ncbi:MULTISPECIES: adenosylcobinamide-phosphate synthase CbiB [Henriciella]|uniref:adenosylcobinamide-phosphate synthase CbiB n=1 Tax=Henriciella TaxID=453849 RepID=UPI003511836A
MTSASLMLAAWSIEAAFGWPDWLYRLIRHPVVWFGALTGWLDAALNHPASPHRVRYSFGAIAALLAVVVATTLAWLLSRLLPDTWAGFAVEALVASSLLASRSLYQHVSNVAQALIANDLPAARKAVSLIVGRNPEQLDEAGVARASIESLAENASDGVVAPLFWGALFGLPGLVAYKAINTLDSVIGHRNDQYAAFGGFAARLDDVANLVPARLTGLLISLAGGSMLALKVMIRDAGRHRSPNAGWPEAAMAGALNVRLSGPRLYGGHRTDEPWLNPQAQDPDASDVRKALRVYVLAMAAGALLLGGFAMIRGTM